jgi:hypothetical protein
MGGVNVNGFVEFAAESFKNHFDFFSLLDVEGAEDEVVKSLDFVEADDYNPGNN